jgi:hypothetical protein
MNGKFLLIDLRVELRLHKFCLINLFKKQDKTKIDSQLRMISEKQLFITTKHSKLQ